MVQSWIWLIPVKEYSIFQMSQLFTSWPKQYAIQKASNSTEQISTPSTIETSLNPKRYLTRERERGWEIKQKKTYQTMPYAPRPTGFIGGTYLEGISKRLPRMLYRTNLPPYAGIPLASISLDSFSFSIFFSHTV